jgi:feruloyl esterase
MEAWKYPDDFDAVISGAPALRFTQSDILWAWETRTNTGPDGKNALAFAKVPMLAEAAYKASADIGGLIDNPKACRFDPKALQCRATDGPDCLTSAEVAVVEKWYDGPRNSKGEQLSPGYARGTEPYWMEWPNGTDEASWRLYKGHTGERLRYYGFVQDPDPTSESTSSTSTRTRRDWLLA